MWSALFFMAHLSGGSRLDPAKSIFRKIRIFPETLGRRRNFLKSPRRIRNLNDTRARHGFLIVPPAPYTIQQTLIRVDYVVYRSAPRAPPKPGLGPGPGLAPQGARGGLQICPGRSLVGLLHCFEPGLGGRSCLWFQCSTFAGRAPLHTVRAMR